MLQTQELAQPRMIRRRVSDLMVRTRGSPMVRCLERSCASSSRGPGPRLMTPGSTSCTATRLTKTRPAQLRMAPRNQGRTDSSRPGTTTNSLSSTPETLGSQATETSSNAPVQQANEREDGDADRARPALAVSVAPPLRTARHRVEIAPRRIGVGRSRFPRRLVLRRAYHGFTATQGAQWTSPQSATSTKFLTVTNWIARLRVGSCCVPYRKPLLRAGRRRR